jgi:hypothetical protein
VFLRPIGILFDTPEIDDIANEEQILRFNRMQEMQQRLRLATPETQVHIGYPYASNFHRCGFIDHRIVSHKLKIANRLKRFYEITLTY